MTREGLWVPRRRTQHPEVVPEPSGRGRDEAGAGPGCPRAPAAAPGAAWQQSGARGRRPETSHFLGHVGDDGLGAGLEEELGFDEGSDGVAGVRPRRARLGAGLAGSPLHQDGKGLLQLHHLPVEDVVTHDEDGDPLEREARGGG